MSDIPVCSHNAESYDFVWPPRHSILGVPISATDYRSAVNCLISAARNMRPALATALAVHGVVEASRDRQLADKISTFELVTPDGQPVRHALNILHSAGLPDRVYGPSLMILVCERASVEGIGIYLYGSTTETVECLRRVLLQRIPELRIVGAEPSLFRPLTREESLALSQRITASGAGIVFLGLGCPRQEHFAFEHRELIPAVQVCVGAAFDFHAGVKRQAPKWMQDCSLEWFFRLTQEPRRLFRRYAVTNSLFLLWITLQYARVALRTKY